MVNSRIHYFAAVTVDDTSAAADDLAEDMAAALVA